MNEKLRGKLTHLTLALLLACGLLMPVLRVLGRLKAGGEGDNRG